MLVFLLHALNTEPTLSKLTKALGCYSIKVKIGKKSISSQVTFTLYIFLQLRKKSNKVIKVYINQGSNSKIQHILEKDKSEMQVLLEEQLQL